MNKNLLVVAVGAAMAMGAGSASACISTYRMVATPPPAPKTQVTRWDDSGTNGRLWSRRPIVNDGPAPYYSGNPGAEAYGAWGEEDQVVYVQVGATAVSISPWHQFTGGGMHTFETARQQWLAENGYAGGVRTIRRDAPAEEAASHAMATTKLPQPRATIQVPDGARRKPGYHVDSRKTREGAGRPTANGYTGGVHTIRRVARAEAPAPHAMVTTELPQPRATIQIPEGARRKPGYHVDSGKTGDEPVRTLGPMNAPVEARARTEARGGYLTGTPAKTIEVAQREP